MEESYYSPTTSHKANTPYDMEAESLMHMLGYNVSSVYDLSDKQRWCILDNIVSSKIMTKAQIIAHLDYLIKRSSGNTSFYTAISKWERDRSHVRDLSLVDIPTYGVKSIHNKKNADKLY